MEVFPILFYHGESGVVGMWSEVFTTEAEALAKIAELQADDQGFTYHTQSLDLVFKVQ